MIIVGFADNIMVGHYSTAALASASFVNNMFNAAIFCCLGFTYGITPLAGAMFAHKSTRDIGSLMRTALRLNTVFTLIVIAVMTIIYLNIDRLGQPEELLPLIRPYYLIYLAGMLPVAVFNVFAQWSYAINNTSLPMWIILCANAINIVGNYIFIFGHFGMPEMGLNGAGWSTFVSRLICSVTIMSYFFLHKKYRGYRDGYFNSTRNKKSYVTLWRTSIPVAMQMTFESGSFTVAAVIAGWLGAIPLAAFQIIVITGTLGFCIYYSIGAAVTVRVANAAGTADNREMRRVAWAGYHIMLTLMTISSLVFIFFGRQLMNAFTDDTEVLKLACSLIFPLVLYQIADATQINFANALRGTSHVMPMLWIAFVSYVIFGIPATYILAFPLGMETYGIILSFSVSLIIAAVLFLYYFLRNTRHTG